MIRKQKTGLNEETVITLDTFITKNTDLCADSAQAAH